MINCCHLKVNTLKETNIRYVIEQLEAIVPNFNQVLDELLKLLQQEDYIRECQSILSDWNNVKASLVLHLQKYEIDNIKPSFPSSLPEDRKSTTSSVRTSCSVQQKKRQAHTKVAALQSKIVVEEEIIQQKKFVS